MSGRYPAPGIASMYAAHGMCAASNSSTMLVWSYRLGGSACPFSVLPAFQPLSLFTPQLSPLVAAM